MSGKDREEWMTPVEADEEERRSPADLHPEKSRMAWADENTVSFPDIRPGMWVMWNGEKQIITKLGEYDFKRRYMKLTTEAIEGVN